MTFAGSSKILQAMHPDRGLGRSIQGVLMFYETFSLPDGFSCPRESRPQCKPMESWYERCVRLKEGTFSIPAGRRARHVPARASFLGYGTEATRTIAILDATSSP
jgi:hypothetical protein